MNFKQVKIEEYINYEGIIKHFYPNVFASFQERKGTLFTTQRYPHNDVIYFIEDEVYIIVEQIKNKATAQLYLMCYPSEYEDRQVKLYTNNALIFDVVMKMNMKRENGYFLFTYGQANNVKVKQAANKINKNIKIAILVVAVFTLGKCALFTVIEMRSQNFLEDSIRDQDWNDYFFDENDDSFWSDEEDSYYDDGYYDDEYDDEYYEEEQPVQEPVGV